MIYYVIYSDSLSKNATCSKVTGLISVAAKTRRRICPRIKSSICVGFSHSSSFFSIKGLTVVKISSASLFQSFSSKISIEDICRSSSFLSLITALINILQLKAMRRRFLISCEPSDTGRFLSQPMMSLNTCSKNSI